MIENAEKKKNIHLGNAKNAKQDEFYTQYQDIQAEINAYLEYDKNVFKNKTILLPCDDPEWSNFTKFFAQNFSFLGLKKLISTSYAVKSKNIEMDWQPTLFESMSPLFNLDKTEIKGKIFTLTQDKNANDRIDIEDLQWQYMEGDGDFRSEEVQRLYDEADIIVTNPPFSLFREFLSWIFKKEKKFLIIGNMNAISYKEVFPLIMQNKMWLGASIHSGDREFQVPKEYILRSPSRRIDNEGRHFVRVSGVRWFTNLDHGRRHEKLNLMTMSDNIKFNKKLKGKGYQKYDNYDAIEVPFTDAIPSDYFEIKGDSLLTRLNIDSAEFEPMFTDIKERYLSSMNFPKLIIGTGLSIAMDIPGMSKLAEKLEESFVETIRNITSEFILDEEYNKHSNVFNNTYGFEKLLKYLLGTVSVNNQIIDIMTPNYDRIIELICDKLKLPTTLGFSGNMYQTFNENILKQPHEYFSKNVPLLRLFKPHGSVNWIKKNDKEYQINDYKLLKDNRQYIDIIAPGSMKYKSGMINSVFRYHREIFNELITDPKKSYSIFIYGYGFNDQHFNTVFEDTQKDVVVLTRTIKKSFLDRAMRNANWTLFYKYEDKKESTAEGSYMVYKGKKYNINRELWDINVFSETFLG